MNAVPHARRLLSDQAYARIDRELKKYPPERKRSAVIAALALAQDEYGWVSQEVIEDVASYLGLPNVAVYEVASFYTLFNTKPIGRYKLSVCTNLPCALHDGAKAGEYLKERLGIDYGQTTPDGLFTLMESECLGSCGDAPVLLVNNKRMCSFMGNAQLDALLDELRAQAAQEAKAGPQDGQQGSAQRAPNGDGHGR
ncbi:MAG: NADH-quinone oxidoreductase subunit NuoE [Burkholderiaceae bacterium]|nr:NADH-quinone oxidoreductase subunit NuoE [Burkholderiaceae bacterium]